MHDTEHSIYYCINYMKYNLMFSCLPLHVHFRWGVALVGKFIYWALLTPSWKNIFRYRRYIGRGNTSENLVKKKARFGFVMYFVNFG